MVTSVLVRLCHYLDRSIGDAEVEDLAGDNEIIQAVHQLRD